MPRLAAWSRASRNSVVSILWRGKLSATCTTPTFSCEALSSRSASRIARTGGGNPLTPIAQGYVHELMPRRTLSFNGFRFRCIQATLVVVTSLVGRNKNSGQLQGYVAGVGHLMI